MQQVNSIFSTSTSSTSKPNLRQSVHENFWKSGKCGKASAKSFFPSWRPVVASIIETISSPFPPLSRREFILSEHFRRIQCGQLQRGGIRKAILKGGGGTGSRKSVCENMEEKCTLGLERKGHSGKRAVEMECLLL